MHIAQARCTPHRLMVGLRRPDAGYGPLELWDLQRRGPPVWSCAPDMIGRGSLCAVEFASETDSVVAGMSSGSMCIYDVRVNRSRSLAELKHSSSSCRFPAVLAMQMLADMRSFVAVGEASVDVWDCRYLNQARHTTCLSRAPLPSVAVGVPYRPRHNDPWPGICGHALFDPNIHIVGADFDAADSVVLLLSTGAAVVMDLTTGTPVQDAVVKPCVDLCGFDLKGLGPHGAAARSDDSVRFGVAWGKQGGRRVLYMSDNKCPLPPTGELGLSGSNAGLYCVFPDHPSCSPPPNAGEEALHWMHWWARCRPTFPATSSALPAAHEAEGEGSERVRYNIDGDRPLRSVRLLSESSHVPLPPGNSRVNVDNVLAIAASESFDLVAVATANGYLQTARARKPPSLNARALSAGEAKGAVFSRGSVALCRAPK